MCLSSGRLGFFLSLSIAAAGCKAPSTGDLTLPLPHQLPDTASLRFDDPSTLTLPVGGSQALHVTATPPMQYGVGFTLLGSSLDGSLDDSVVFTGQDGHGDVTLHAPTQPTTFRVRASLLDESGMPGPTAERAVSVSEHGFGTVEVTPSYIGGRTVTTWTASVVASSCAALESAGVLPGEPQGSITATAPFGSDPLLQMAPVGLPLAVAVRGGHFAWGCTDTTMLTAGDVLMVPVTVLDVPLDLADADLSATFAYTPDQTAYDAVLADATSTLLDAFMPLSSSEGTIVLNGMAAATSPADAATFAVQRVNQSWDMLADQHFSSLSQSLRDTCGGWSTAGLAAQPTLVQGTLAGGPAGHLNITLSQFGNLDPSLAGAGVVPGSMWSSLPDDSVLLSASLYWEPSRFAGSACKAPALMAQPSAADVASALAMEADCHGLAALLGPFGSCDVTCVEQLCDTAIASRWQTALATSNKTMAFGSLVIQGSGLTTVGDIAEPITLTGQWQGQIGTPTAQVQLKGGTLTASQVATP